MRYITSLVVLLLFMSISAQATAVTVDIYGTNVSNAQSNLTQTGNNSYTVTAWGTGDNTKTIRADIDGNASDTITFTLHNITVSRVMEVKVNGTSYNAYQADSTGTISFSRTQSVKNQTYVIAPALQQGGYNYTWAWFWNTLYMGVLPNTSIPTSALNITSTYVKDNNTGVINNYNYQQVKIETGTVTFTASGSVQNVDRVITFQTSFSRILSVSAIIDINGATQNNNIPIASTYQVSAGSMTIRAGTQDGTSNLAAATYTGYYTVIGI